MVKCSKLTVLSAVDVEMFETFDHFSGCTGEIQFTCVVATCSGDDGDVCDSRSHLGSCLVSRAASCVPVERLPMMVSVTATRDNVSVDRESLVAAVINASLATGTTDHADVNVCQLSALLCFIIVLSMP